MDIEEVEEKRPRFLWIVVVAVVAAALAVFILIQSGRMKPKVPGVQPERQELGQQAPMPDRRAWPAPDTAALQERAPEVPVEEAPPAPEIGKEPPAPAKPEPRSERPRIETAPARQPQRASAPLVLPTSETGRFVVQVGAYSDERVARVQVDKMKKLGYAAWVESADVPGKGRFHRVRIGAFDSFSDAERVADSMSAVLGNNCWVDNR